MNDSDDPRWRDLEERLIRSRLAADPPEVLLQQAIDAFALRRRETPASAVAGPGRRLLHAIRLVDDAVGGALQALAGLGQAAAGPGAVLAGALRGDGDSGRHFVFSAEGIDVELRVAPGDDADHWSLCGQVLASLSAGQAVMRCGDYEVVADLSEHAEFRFDAVPPGDAMLRLRTPDWEMLLPAVPLPPRA